MGGVQLLRRRPAEPGRHEHGHAAPRRSAVHLVAHETYPGHHTEHAWKEQLLVRERAGSRRRSLMIGTPQALIARASPRPARGPARRGRVERVGASTRPVRGRVRRRARARREGATPRSTTSSANVAFMVHADGASTDEAARLHRAVGLASESAPSTASASSPTRSGARTSTTYTDGDASCASWVDGDPERFRRLLTEQLTPADLL